MEKLLAVINLGQNAYSTWLFQYLLPRILALLTLIFITAIMTSVVLIGSVFLLYHTCLALNITPSLSLLITASFALLITGLCILLTRKYLRLLYATPAASQTQPSIKSSLMDIAHAFLKGFLEKK